VTAPYQEPSTCFWIPLFYALVIFTFLVPPAHCSSPSSLQEVIAFSLLFFVVPLPFAVTVVPPAVWYLTAARSFDVIDLTGYIVISDFPSQTFTVEDPRFKECWIGSISPLIPPIAIVYFLPSARSFTLANASGYIVTFIFKRAYTMHPY
jgi:hypothetical protein